jgi:hypothetical protein
VGGHGGPTSDNQIIAASPGEYVVKASSVNKYGHSMMKAINAGKFAGGGLVGNAGTIGSAMGGDPAWVSNKTVMFEGAALRASMLAAIRNFKQAQASMMVGGGIGLAGVINTSGYAALKSAAAKAGWTGSLWNDLYNVEMAEAGFNIHAQNPGSGAYGMAQFINGASEYAQYGGNSYTAAGQAVGMVNYIKQRYGNPAAAWAHEQADHWYGDGLNAVVNGPTVIGVGERGPEHVSVTPVGRGGSCSRIVIDIQGGSDEMKKMIRKWVRIEGGGDVQLAFGTDD